MSCTAQISVHVPDLHSAVTGSVRQTQEVREDKRKETMKMSAEKHPGKGSESEGEGSFPSFNLVEIYHI